MEYKYNKYKHKYLELKNQIGGDHYNYYKYYTRSGIIPYFNKLLDDNTMETYFIMTEYKINDDIVISDFGGHRDDHTIDPIINSFKKYIEQNTYLENPNDTSQLNNPEYIQHNNILGKNINTLKSKLGNGSFISLFDSIEKINIYNYLYLVNIDDISGIKWANTTIDFTYQNIQSINNILIIKKSYIPKVKNKMLNIINDTLNKYSELLIYVQQLDNYLLRDKRESLVKYEAQVPKCTTMDNLCNNFNPKINILNDDNINTFACFPISKDQKSGIKYINIPQGYYLYKGMNADARDNNDFLNTHATSFTWYSDLLTAMTYVYWYNNKEKKNFKIFPFKTQRDIKLFYLLDTQNLEILYNIIIQNIQNKLKEQSYNVKNMYEKIHTIRRYMRQLKYLRLTTGFKMTWKEQLEEMRKMGLEKTIIKRKKNLDEFNDKHYFSNRCEIDGTYFSGLYNDLNRVSPTLKSDKYMMEAICENLNMDGYIVKQLPSLWHLNGRFNAEIALCISRGLLAVDLNNPYYDENSVQYNDKMKIAKEKTIPVVTYNTVLIDIDTMFDQLNDPVLKFLYGKYHIILFTHKNANEIHKMNRLVHGIENYVLRILYDFGPSDLSDNEYIIGDVAIIFSKNPEFIKKYPNLVKSSF